MAKSWAGGSPTHPTSTPSVLERERGDASAMHRHHGTRTRGIEAVPQGPFFEGRFGRMFRELPTFGQDEDELRRLGEAMVENGGGTSTTPPYPRATPTSASSSTTTSPSIPPRASSA